jgi:hypothetical protein
MNDDQSLLTSPEVQRMAGVHGRNANLRLRLQSCALGSSRFGASSPDTGIPSRSFSGRTASLDLAEPVLVVS